MPVYAGSCHCGAVRISVETSAPPERLIDCNCSVCRKKGILHMPAELSELKMLDGAEAVETYRFGSGVAEHCFCRQCGIHVYGRPRNSPHRYTVNARCLDDFEAIKDAAEIVRFNGLNHPKDNV